LNNIGKLLAAVGSALQSNPVRFHFSNSSIGLPMDSGVLSRDAPSADATTWPTPDQIQNALLAYHNAKSAMMSAWASIPRDIQAGLKEPPVRR
jgi:hypothetical protein